MNALTKSIRGFRRTPAFTGFVLFMAALLLNIQQGHFGDQLCL